MATDDIDEHLMTRFVLGDVTPEEHDRVERRFVDDPSFLDELCALEEEVLLSHARGALPLQQQELLRKRLHASPVLRRQFEEVQALAAAARRTSGVAPPASRRPRISLVTWVAAAAVIPIAVIGVMQVARSRQPQPSTSAPVTAPAPARVPVPTFLLAPGNVRTLSEPQANVLRLPAEAGTVSLVVVVSAQTLNDVRAELRVVGGPVAEEALDVRLGPRDGVVEIAVAVPARLLPPRDYLLTLSADSGAGGRSVVATRFFSVVP